MLTEKEKRTGDETYELWLSRVRMALQWRKDNYDLEWTRCYDLFKGQHWRDRDTDDPRSDEVRNRITVNITAANVTSIVPFLLNDQAKFKATPRKLESYKSAQLQEEILNYEYSRQNMQAQIQKSVYDSAIIGHGIIKTGFILEIDTAVSEKDGDIVYEDYVEEETPYVKRIDPFLFLFDPNASEYDLKTSRWCAEIYFKYIPDIVSNESYKKSVRDKIKSGEYKITTKSSLFGENQYAELYSWSKENNPVCDLGVLYEVWDKKFNKMYVFADGVPEPLIEKDNPYDYLKGEFPYVKVDYIYVPNDCYGIGIPYLIEDLQLELNRRRTAGLVHCRRFNRKYEVLRTGLDDISKQQLIEGEDGTLVEVNQMGSVKPIEDAPLSQDYQLMEAISKNDARELTGADALVQGGQLPSRTTAGEVNARTNLFMLKLDDRIKAVRDFVLSIGKQVSAHISGNYVTEKVIRIVGNDGISWVRYTAEDIKDEVDWDMESVNAPKIDPVLERQQRIQIFQIAMQLLPLIQAGVVKINVNEMVRWVFESFGMKDIGRFFENTPIANPLAGGPGGLSGNPGTVSDSTTVPDVRSEGAGTGNQMGMQ